MCSFEAPARDAAALERRIERALREALGYDVVTFIRPAADLAAIAAYQPFRARGSKAGGATLFIGFLKSSPSAATRSTLAGLGTDDDQFHLHGRELYWLRRGRFSDSPYSGAHLEKALGSPATLRNANTVRRMAARLG